MPPTTVMLKLIDALQSGKTDINRALDHLFTSPGRHQGHQHYVDLQNPAQLNTLPGWAEAELRNLPNVGLNQAAIDHINAWPNDQKEKVRDALVLAINKNRNVQFFWELWDGNEPDTKIYIPGGPAGAADIIVTFRTPKSRMRVVGHEVEFT